jgi:hypothetical protein
MIHIGDGVQWDAQGTIPAGNGLSSPSRGVPSHDAAGCPRADHHCRRPSQRGHHDHASQSRGRMSTSHNSLRSPCWLKSTHRVISGGAWSGGSRATDGSSEAA